MSYFKAFTSMWFQRVLHVPIIKSNTSTLYRTLKVEDKKGGVGLFTFRI